MWRALFSAVAVFAVDQVSKIWVIYWLDLVARGTVEVFPPYLTFVMAWNRGINFGLLAGHAELLRWGLIALAVAVSVWVLWWARREPAPVVQISAGALAGGALGNALDRVLYGAVADFLNMSCCGIDNPFAFNIADVAIFAGAAGLVLFSGRHKTP